MRGARGEKTRAMLRLKSFWKEANTSGSARGSPGNQPNPTNIGAALVDYITPAASSGKAAVRLELLVLDP